jgi:hypothetical protein
MKKFFIANVILVFCISMLVPTLKVNADLPTAYFSITNYIGGSGSGRYGYCKTQVVNPGATYRPQVKCELQDNAGTRINYQEDYSYFGASSASKTVLNSTGDTGHITFWTTHIGWINATQYVEYRVVANG